MANPDYMNKSSRRGIFLSITLLFSIIIIVIPSNVYAEEVNVKSFAFEETTIIEVTNDSDELVNSFRIWLGSDFSFKSFKTEEGFEVWSHSDRAKHPLPKAYSRPSFLNTLDHRVA